MSNLIIPEVSDVLFDDLKEMIHRFRFGGLG